MFDNIIRLLILLCCTYLPLNNTKTVLFCYFYYRGTVGKISTKQYYVPRFFRSKRGESGDRAKTRKSKTPDPFSDTEISPERGHRRPNPQIKVSQVYSTLI